jgi:Concanavalin A-like lectin/glucanases superfamily
MVWVRKVGWKADDWHHVVLTWHNFDTGKEDARATLYIDGKRIGVVKDRAIAMGWDAEQARVFFALGYVGLIDEMALFNRELTEAEVKALHKTPGMLAGLKK